MYRSIYNQNNTCDHKRSKLSTYISADIFVLSFNDKYILYSITIYKDQTVDHFYGGYLKIDTLFDGDGRFRRSLGSINC